MIIYSHLNSHLYSHPESRLQSPFPQALHLNFQAFLSRLFAPRLCLVGKRALKRMGSSALRVDAHDGLSSESAAAPRHRRAPFRSGAVVALERAGGAHPPSALESLMVDRP